MRGIIRSLRHCSRSEQIQTCNRQVKSSVDGNTALHRTVAKGHYKVAWLLLKHKANPNLPTEAVIFTQLGKTPLHIAVETNNKKLVQLLLRYDADPSIRDKSSQLPVDLCRSQDIERQFVDGCSEVATPCDLSMESIDPVMELPQDSVRETKELLDVIITVRNSGKDDSDDLIFTPEQIVSPQGFKVFNFETGPQQPLSRKCSSIMEPECENTVRNSIRTPPIRSFSFGHEPKKSLLFNWLKKLRLDLIFEQLIDAGYDDLDLLLGQMRSEMPLTLSHLQEIGIEKPGHRTRLLAGLEEAVGRSGIEEQKKEPDQGFSLSFCTVSQAVCGLALLPTLQQWLDGLKLKHLYQNFVETGYDDLEHLLALMHTNYPITDEVLKSEVNIYKLGHRHRLLFKLKQDCAKAKKMVGGGEVASGMTMEREEKGAACELCQLM